ncbi:monovalent cation/H+ antiporter complex subunit F [candidate division KSB1 bacterium]
MTACIVILIICCFMCLYRVAFGPTPSDRIVANDILGIILVGFCAIYSAVTKEDLYMNIALAWALLSFIGTIALAKYLEGRTYDD